MRSLQLNIGTSAYAAVLRIVSRFHEAIFSDPESPTGLNQSLDFRSVILEYDAQLSQCHEEWMGRFERDSDLTGPSYSPGLHGVLCSDERTVTLGVQILP